MSISVGIENDERKEQEQACPYKLQYLMDVGTFLLKTQMSTSWKSQESTHHQDGICGTINVNIRA